MCNPDALVFVCFRRGHSKKNTLFLEPRNLSTQLQKEGKLNGIVIDKSNHKDMVTDEVGVPNDILHV